MTGAGGRHEKRSSQALLSPLARCTGRRLTARTFNSGFSQAHDTYNGISVASDGNVYDVFGGDTADLWTF